MSALLAAPAAARHMPSKIRQCSRRRSQQPVSVTARTRRSGPAERKWNSVAGEMALGRHMALACDRPAPSASAVKDPCWRVRPGTWFVDGLVLLEWKLWPAG